MKAILLATLTLLAALPASAIPHGGCCARVGGSCISSCNKIGGCTGSGDCTLTWTTGASLASTACRPALPGGIEPAPARLENLTRPALAVAPPAPATLAPVSQGE
jgi:hypothetical protein